MAPGFHLYSSNSLQPLAAVLAARLAHPPDALSLAPEIILIPQPSLRRWLQEVLASTQRVAANLQFPTAAEFTWRLLRADVPALPEDSPWDQERLQWRLFALLEDTTRLPAPLQAHLAHAGGGGLARWHLSQALARSFDKYQAYRRGMLERWEHGDAPEDWQAQLWRQLRAQTQVPPRSTLIGNWLRRHGNGRRRPPGLPARLSAFGTINISPDVLQMLATAAHHLPLDFHRPSPCAEYWGDVEHRRADANAGELLALCERAEAENPLLQAWGAAGRDFVAQLYSYAHVTPQQEHELFIEPEGSSLLQALQRDVLNRTPPTPLNAQATRDGSLQLHACHSRLREVEVLHDQLRALFEDTQRFTPPLQPHEVAVLAPDIGAYLPLVRAVFGGLSPSDARFIPWSATDRPQLQTHPLIGFFLALLTLPMQRLDAETLLDWLAVPSIMAGLGWQDADIGTLRRWFAASGYRWGFDEDDRTHAGVGTWREFSAAFALDRLLLGYATGGEAMIGGIAALPLAEGHDADRLDGWIKVARRLRALAQWMRGAHTAAQWQKRLARDFLGVLAPHAIDDAEDRARRLVLDTLGAFATQAADSGTIGADVVAAALNSALTVPSPHQPFLSGGVTFAGMVPLRTVPFRVICVLGMDADAYPRRDPADDINRMLAELRQGQRQPGDRSLRDDDRFLFLQLLCAAGDVFYISHGGFNARDNRPLDASALVDDLQDVVEAMTGERLNPTQHPLQPFSARAFLGNTASYRHEWLPPEPTTLRTPQPFADLPVPALPATQDLCGEQRVSLAQLQRFWLNPARHWLRQGLDLRLPDADDLLPEQEPLGSNALARYQLVQRLLEDPAGVERLRAEGLLAPGREGDAQWAEAEAIAAPLREARDAWLGTEAASRAEIALPLRGALLHGRLHGVHGRRRAHVLPGRFKGRHWLRAWIEHLAFVAQFGESAQGRVLYAEAQRDGSRAAIWRGIGALTREDARAQLQQLIDGLRVGQSRPLRFTPDLALLYVDTARSKGEAAAWDAVHRQMEDGYSETNGASLELAFRPEGLIAENADHPHSREFIAWAERVFSHVPAVLDPPALDTQA